MNKNVLLVEPVQNELPSLALMKLSTKHKAEGDSVTYSIGNPYFLNIKPDIIYISTLFTWNYFETVECISGLRERFPNAQIHVGGILATLLKDKLNGLYKNHNVDLHIGLDMNIEKYKPDYSLFPNIQFSICRTTRGCPNKCPWCMVKDVEPIFEELSDWWKAIDISKPKIIFYDNNFFASSKKHFDDVMDFLEMIQKPFDFNQALDVRKFDEYKAERMSRVKVHPLRFAYDSEAQREAIVKGIELAFNHDTTDISVLMLYNFNDTPESIWERLERMSHIESNGHQCRHIYIFPMKYQPLDTLTKSDFIGENWTQDMLENFNRLRTQYFANGILRFNSPNHFYQVFGKTPEIFREKIEKKVEPIDWRGILAPA